MNRDAPARRAAVRDTAALAMAAGYAAITFALYCVWKGALAERSADPAIFENCLWHAVHGLGLRSPIEGGVDHLAIHFSPALYLLVPLYAVFHGMHVVHAVVCAGTAAAGFVLYRMASEEVDGTTSLLVMLAFLLHPTVVLQTFMEFHEQALVPLPLMLALYGARRGWRAGLLAACVATLSIREDNLLFVGMLGLLLLFRRDARRSGFALAALAAGWFTLYQLAGRAMLAHSHLPPVFANTYSELGGTPAAIVRTVLTQPLRVVAHAFSRPALAYLAQLLFPLLGVAGLGDLSWLTMLPQLGMILLSDAGSRMLQVRLHFSLVPVLALYVGAIATLRRATRWPSLPPTRRMPAARLIALLMLAASLLTVPVWARRAVARLNPGVAGIRAALAGIPDTASVAAPGYLLNELARRREPALLWHEADLTRTEWVVLEEPRLRFFDGSSVDLPYSEHAVAVLREHGYRQVFERDGRHIWRRQPV